MQELREDFVLAGGDVNSEKSTAPFIIQFSPRALDHLKAFPKRDQQIILHAIQVNLTIDPDRETRRKKKLEENVLAPWELRVGNFRVFYDIDQENRLVVIVAIGKKDHNILHIEGKEIHL